MESVDEEKLKQLLEQASENPVKEEEYEDLKQMTETQYSRNILKMSSEKVFPLL